jgi:acyl carrier protein
VTPDEVRATVLRVLGEIAPEADLSALEPDVGIRDQVDLDSMDVLNVVVGLHAALGVEIPEADYARLATLDGCVAYLLERGAAASGPPAPRASPAGGRHPAAG